MDLVSDRLRDLLDLVVGSLDDPGVDGRTLARRASFSRDHLDRVLAAATGETPVALRRRLLLERAAWRLRHGAASGDEAVAAGYGSPEAFTRAFARAYGVPPRAFAASALDVAIDAPNGIHFLGPAGFVVPGPPVRTGRDVTDRLLAHHLDRTRELLTIVEALTDEERDRVVRPGLVIVWFEGAEETARLLAERSVATLEVWTAAMGGEPRPPAPDRELLRRFDHVTPAFGRIAADLRERGAWDDAFVDALCEPPQSFTYGGVLAHILSYGAVRRETLAGLLVELGHPPSGSGDPILWEQDGP